MRLKSFSELNSVNSVVNIAIGIFDGVHRGHAAVINEACSQSGVAVVMTFDPHPISIVNPSRAPKILNSIGHRQTLIERLGVKYFMVLPFNHDRAHQCPDQFLDEIVESCRLGSICVGDDFRFGKGRKGDAKLIEKFAKRYDFKVRVVKRIKDDSDCVISSSRVRGLLANAELNAATKLLGRKFSVSGVIEKGNMLGRKLGFPTANLDCLVPEMMPHGVYAIKALHNNEHFNGIANLGFRPTINDVKDTKPLLEVHLFDFDQDLYGQELEVLFVDFLRPEKKFSNIDALKLQINKDIIITKNLLNEDS